MFLFQRALQNQEVPDFLDPDAAAATMGIAAQAAAMGFVPVLPAIHGMPGFPQPPTPPPSTASEEDYQKKPPKLPYQQGVTVKIQTQDPIVNRKTFKVSLFHVT